MLIAKLKLPYARRAYGLAPLHHGTSHAEEWLTLRPGRFTSKERSPMSRQGGPLSTSRRSAVTILLLLPGIETQIAETYRIRHSCSIRKEKHDIFEVISCSELTDFVT